MTQGLNENVDIPGGCEALVEFCDVMFKTRPHISSQLSHALVWVFEFFETMTLRFVKSRVKNYGIIVDNIDNEIVLIIRIPDHIVIKTPFTTVGLTDICEETRSIVYSVDNMVRKEYKKTFTNTKYTKGFR